MDTFDRFLQIKNRGQGKDVLAVARIINGEDVSKTKSFNRSEAVVSWAEQNYSDILTLCKVAYPFCNKYKTPLALVVAATFTGFNGNVFECEHFIAELCKAKPNQNTTYSALLAWVIEKQPKNERPAELCAMAYHWDRQSLFTAITTTAKAVRDKTQLTSLTSNGAGHLLDKLAQKPQERFPYYARRESHARIIADMLAMVHDSLLEMPETKMDEYKKRMAQDIQKVADARAAMLDVRDILKASYRSE